MLSIGEFSKICLVTTKTLRYYDEIGLIRPAYINDENGYRYYDISQLKTILIISRLKEYELSLDEISVVLSDGSDELMLQKISQKEKELQTKREHYAFLLNNLKTDIQNLKRGIKIMSHLDNLEVKLTEQKPINIFCLRQNMSVKDFEKNFRTLFKQAAKEKLTINGNPLAIYYDKEFNPDSSDIEVGIPVKEVVKGTREMQQSLCATIRLAGPYSELPGCYARLTQWIEKEGYIITAPPYEVYVNDPCETRPEDLITDIYFPVKKK